MPEKTYVRNSLQSTWDFGDAKTKDMVGIIETNIVRQLMLLLYP